MNAHGRRWYMTAIAGLYVVLCGGFLIYYASLYFRVGGARVALSKQLLCLGMAISAAVYFFNAKVGHRGLLALTALTILAIGTTDPRATAFHATVLLILLIPFAVSRSKRTGDHANEVMQGTLRDHCP